MRARTGAELVDQLRRAGYSPGDALVGAAYELTAALYPSLRTGTGRSQMEHVVGTASILCDLEASATVIAASLIHNVYENGDFGEGDVPFETKRERVRRAVGAAVEERVRRFSQIKSAIHSSDTRFTSFDALDREVALIAVVEALEHARHGEWHGSTEAAWLERAEQLGDPRLATEVRRAFAGAPR